MLTMEQVKKYSEISVKTFSDIDSSFESLPDYKLRICYLKDDKLCRLSIFKGCDILATLTEKSLSEWNENHIKELIPSEDWEEFTCFINDSEILNEDMLLSEEQLAVIRQSRPMKQLGTHRMLDHGTARNIDVQANIRHIQRAIGEAIKKF